MKNTQTKNYTLSVESDLYSRTVHTEDDSWVSTFEIFYIIATCSLGNVFCYNMKSFDSFDMSKEDAEKGAWGLVEKMESKIAQGKKDLNPSNWNYKRTVYGSPAYESHGSNEWRHKEAKADSRCDAEYLSICVAQGLY